MSSTVVPTGTMKKTVIELPAQYVDAANDSLKWLVVLVIAFAWNRQLGTRFGQGNLIDPRTALNDTLRTAGVTALGLFVYHFIIQRVVVFMPKAGQSTYYMALKRA